MESSNLDPWKRANLEQFNVETLALIPQGQQREYITLMKELAHAKGIASLVLERVHMFEQERAAFFEPFISSGVPDSHIPDYTPVTDLNEYRGRHG